MLMPAVQMRQGKLLQPHKAGDKSKKREGLCWEAAVYKSSQ